MATLEKDALDHQIENFNYATSLIRVILLIVAFSIFMYSRYAFIFFSAAVLPSLAVIFTDRAPHKCASATICTFNLIGVSPYLRELWMSQAINKTAKALIADPLSWVIIFLTSFIGLMIYIILPSIIAKIYLAKANLRIASLIDHRNKICSEWEIKLEDTREKEESDILSKI